MRGALETRELLLQAKGPALPSNHQRLDQEAALLWAAFQSSALGLREDRFHCFKSPISGNLLHSPSKPMQMRVNPCYG